MAASSALQSIAYLEQMESAVNDPRLRVAVEPSTVYGLNQQLIFGNFLTKESLEKASQQIKDSGIAEDFGALKRALKASSLQLTDEEKVRVEKLLTLMRENGFKAQAAIEQVALEDGQGIPAIAILVLVVIIIIALWVQVL